jgi:hypothetical protein
MAIMTPAAALDNGAAPLARDAAVTRYSAAYVDGFIRRNRAALEALVAQAMARRRQGPSLERRTGSSSTTRGAGSRARSSQGTAERASTRR